MPDVLRAPQRAPWQWFASTDPERKNEDYLVLKPGETRRVSLAAGPLLRLWSTSDKPETLTLRLQNGVTTDLWKNQKAVVGTLYKKAYSLYPTQSALSAVGDLKTGAALVVTNGSNEPAKWFYQVTVGPRLPASSFSNAQEVTSIVQLTPGQEAGLFPKAKAGVWTQIAITVKPAERERDGDEQATWLHIWRNLRLQARWSGGINADTPNPNDDDTIPGIDVPLLALTGQFWNAEKIESAPVSLSGDTLTLRWPMPFNRNDQISIRNEGQKKIIVSYKIQEVALEPNVVPSYRFHAIYGAAKAKRKVNIPILDVKGEGAFVGLALDIRPTEESPRRAFAYLEGNEILRADGKTYEGTGTEDYFNSAWYYPEEPFAQPYGGMTFKNALPPQVSQYRWMIPDAVPFQKEFQFLQEHGNGNNSDDLEYRWVALWYQKPEGRFKIADELRYGVVVDVSPEKNRERDALVRRYVTLSMLAFLLLGGIIAGVSLRRAATRPKSATKE